MATRSAKRPVFGLRRLKKSEMVVGAFVAALTLMLVFWLVAGDNLRPSNGQLGVNQGHVIDYFGRFYCRPACRTRFHRCEVSTGGFTYQQSRCQETLKQCLLVCDAGGRK